MTKFLPYQQYDVQAIEQWLNRQSLAGFRLVKMDGVFPKFKRYYDHQIYYRVRYCPAVPVSGYDHFWGKLYIYEAFSKADLPAPNYLRDSVEAARRQQTPWYILALLVAFVATVQYVFTENLSVPALISGAAVLISEVIWIAAIIFNFYRGVCIAKETLNPAQQPPGVWLKGSLTAASILSVVLNCIFVLLIEVF